MSSNFYHQLRAEVIECVYCHNRLNLYYINHHLNSSKRCAKLKKIYLEANPNVKDGEFLIYLNGHKKKIKYKALNEEENEDVEEEDK